MGFFDKKYTVAPYESVFIPIRLLPKQGAGGSKLVIHTLLLNENHQEVSQDYFYVTARKNARWELAALAENSQGQRVYFKNGETEKDFSAYVKNTGNYSQEIFLQPQMIGFGLGLIDSTGKVIKNESETFELGSGADTSFQWRVGTVGDQRNVKNISILTHRPKSLSTGKQYSLFLRSRESVVSDSLGFNRASRLDFVRLPSVTSVQNYGGQELPLAVQASYQNIMGAQSVLSLHLNGLKSINQEAYLVYFSNLNFRDVNASNLFQGTPWYIGYFDRQYTAELGTVNGNIPGLTASAKNPND